MKFVTKKFSPSDKSTFDYSPSSMHLQFMQMKHHNLAQSNSLNEKQAQHLQRAIEENDKNSHNRGNLWETCGANYENFVKNLERLKRKVFR
jgi:hypothetical protein